MIRAAAIVAAVGVAACHVQDPVAVATCTTTAECASGTICQDHVCVTPMGGGPDYCAGSGPPILVGDGITVGQAGHSGHDDVCSGEVAERTFRFALCTCDGYAASTTLTTDAFDSTQGAYMPGHPGGSVGTDGAFASNGLAAIGGSLWVSGAGGLILAADVNARGDLQDGGGVDGMAAAMTLGRDAHVAGDITLADLTIPGLLTIAPGRVVAVSGTNAIGATTQAAVTIAPPCDCAPEDLVDIARFAETYRAANDDAKIMLAPTALAAVAAPTTLDLPCGRFFVDSIGNDAALTLHVTGRVALFVGGDATLRAPFTVTIDPGAEIDLFVEGILTSTDHVMLGAPDRPAKARLYVGGAGTIELSGGAQLGGNVYAPRADLALSAPTEVFGALFVKSVATAVPLTIHYDEAVLSSGNACPVMPTTCQTCLDCGNQACTGGTCGACLSDGDCCAPLVCNAGACVPEIP